MLKAGDDPRTSERAIYGKHDMNYRCYCSGHWICLLLDDSGAEFLREYRTGDPKSEALRKIEDVIRSYIGLGGYSMRLGRRD